MSMTLERFEALVAAYGADVARWPAEERLAAHDFAKDAPEAQRLLEEAAALDTLLAAVPTPVASPALMAAVLAHTAQPMDRPAGGIGGFLAALWPKAAAWKPASVFASAMVLGMLLGVNVLGPLVVPTTSASTVASNDDLLASAVPMLGEDANAN